MSDDCGLDHVDGRAYRALDDMYAQLVQREREREARIEALETALRCAPAPKDCAPPSLPPYPKERRHEHDIYDS